jgi:hypothetical protein
MADAATVVDVETFNPNTSYSNQVSGLFWEQNNPSGTDVASATIELDILLFSAGIGFGQLRLMASESNSFNLSDPAQLVGIINRTTNPNDSEFFKVSFPLTGTQVGWLNDDDTLNLALNAPVIVPPGILNPVTWNIKSSTLTMNLVPVPAALPLFATALAGLGVIGWRRSRAS